VKKLGLTGKQNFFIRLIFFLFFLSDLVFLLPVLARPISLVFRENKRKTSHSENTLQTFWLFHNQ